MLSDLSYPTKPPRARICVVDRDMGVVGLRWDCPVPYALEVGCACAADHLMGKLMTPSALRDVSTVVNEFIVEAWTAETLVWSILDEGWVYNG